MVFVSLHPWIPLPTLPLRFSASLRTKSVHDIEIIKTFFSSFDAFYASIHTQIHSVHIHLDVMRRVYVHARVNKKQITNIIF